MEFNTLDKILWGTAGCLAVLGGYFTVQAFNTYIRLRRYWNKCAEEETERRQEESLKLSQREYEDSSLDC